MPMAIGLRQATAIRLRARLPKQESRCGRDSIPGIIRSSRTPVPQTGQTDPAPSRQKPEGLAARIPREVQQRRIRRRIHRRAAIPRIRHHRLQPGTITVREAVRAHRMFPRRELLRQGLLRRAEAHREVLRRGQAVLRSISAIRCRGARAAVLCQHPDSEKISCVSRFLKLNDIERSHLYYNSITILSQFPFILRT